MITRKKFGGHGLFDFGAPCPKPTAAEKKKSEARAKAVRAAVEIVACGGSEDDALALIKQADCAAAVIRELKTIRRVRVPSMLFRLGAIK